jgi:hypothetical protein
LPDEFIETKLFRPCYFHGTIHWCARRDPAYRGMKQLYVSDPDGYSLCFQWPAK